MHITIEPSKTGKTFAVAFAKAEDMDPFFVLKGCKLAQGKTGAFVSGPSTKMDDGKYFNYAFFERKFGDYVLGLVKAAMPAQSNARPAKVIDDDQPF